MWYATSENKYLLTGSGGGRIPNHFLVLTSAVATTTTDASKQRLPVNNFSRMEEDYGGLEALTQKQERGKAIFRFSSFQLRLDEEKKKIGFRLKSD